MVNENLYNKKIKGGTQLIFLLCYYLILLRIMALQRKLTHEERLQKKREAKRLRYEKIDEERMI